MSRDPLAFQNLQVVSSTPEVMPDQGDYFLMTDEAEAARLSDMMGSDEESYEGANEVERDALREIGSLGYVPGR